MRVPEAMHLYWARREGLTEEWNDVMDIVTTYLEMEPGANQYIQVNKPSRAKLEV